VLQLKSRTGTDAPAIGRAIDISGTIHGNSEGICSVCSAGERVKDGKGLRACGSAYSGRQKNNKQPEGNPVAQHVTPCVETNFPDDNSTPCNEHQVKAFHLI
jgi:hypothetical protein